MSRRGIAVMAAVGLVALPSLAGAASRLAATGVRIGDHPAFVRVVVDFNGTLPQRQVQLDALTPTMAWLHVAHATLKGASVAIGEGARVRFTMHRGTQALHLTAGFTRHRFKYVSYTVVTGNRLAIDLWKSDTQTRAAEIRNAGCLALRSWAFGTHSIIVRGSERGIFENTFQVVVRGASGAVLGRKTVTQGSNWRATVPYRSSHRHTAMLEAVAFSPKDGALSCIAQVHVALP